MHPININANNPVQFTGVYDNTMQSHRNPSRISSQSHKCCSISASFLRHRINKTDSLQTTTTTPEPSLQSQLPFYIYFKRKTLNHFDHFNHTTESQQPKGHPHETLLSSPRGLFSLDSPGAVVPLWRNRASHDPAGEPEIRWKEIVSWILLWLVQGACL